MDIFEIILGSYESFVIGIKFRYKSQVSVNQYFFLFFFDDLPYMLCLHEHLEI
jgi:hypothetical protein